MAAGMSEGGGTEGGFLVPSYLIGRILGPLFDSDPILSRVSTIRMPGPSLSVAGFSTTDRSSGAIGGLEMAWTGEGTQMSGQTASIKSVNLNAAKGTILVHASNELLADAPNASIQLEQIFRQAAGYGLTKAVLRGSGVAQPRGVLNDGALIAVAAEGSQTADTVWHANVIKMAERLHPALVANAVWVTSPTVLNQLLALARQISNAAGSDYVGGDILDVTTDLAGQYRMLGIPVVLSEVLPVLGDQGDLLLVDLSQYALGIREDVGIEVSPHLKFDYDQTSFRLKVRVDGAGLWDAALTPEYGDTLSWAVTLAARA
jgi:HK97 family phage major capsid protein